MAYRSFRDYLETLEKMGQLSRLTMPFKCKKGVSELDSLRYYVGLLDGPALLLHDVEDLNTPDIPVVLNAFGSISGKRIALALEEKDWQSALEKHIKAMADYESWLKPIMIDAKQAPCKEIIIKEDDIDFRKQMPFVWFGIERQPYITSGVTVSKDPETGKRNVIWNRYGFFTTDLEGEPYSEELQKRCLTSYMWWNPAMSHIGVHYNKAVRMKRPLEVAIAIECDPAVHIAAASSPAEGMDEFGLAGALRKEPVELVKCETVDLEVPSTAEWVLEGEVLIGPSEIDGPHMHNYGYLSYNELPVTRIKCITHRKNPIWYPICSTKRGIDHALIYEFAAISELLSELQAKISYVKNIAIHPRPQISGMTVVQLSVDGDERPLGIAQQVMHAVWGHSGRYGKYQKYVVVVGPDVDPWDLWDVTWALITRVQPVSDVLTSKGPARFCDPSALQAARTPRVLSEQVGIDATIKIPEKYPEFQETFDCDPFIMERVKNKLGDLFKT